MQEAKRSQSDADTYEPRPGMANDWRARPVGRVQRNVFASNKDDGCNGEAAYGKADDVGDLLVFASDDDPPKAKDDDPPKKRELGPDCASKAAQGESAAGGLGSTHWSRAASPSHSRASPISEQASLREGNGEQEKSTALEPAPGSANDQFLGTWQQDIRAGIIEEQLAHIWQKAAQTTPPLRKVQELHNSNSQPSLTEKPNSCQLAQDVARSDSPGTRPQTTEAGLAFQQKVAQAMAQGKDHVSPGSVTSTKSHEKPRLNAAASEYRPSYLAQNKSAEGGQQSPRSTVNTPSVGRKASSSSGPSQDLSYQSSDLAEKQSASAAQHSQHSTRSSHSTVQAQSLGRTPTNASALSQDLPVTCWALCGACFPTASAAVMHLEIPSSKPCPSMTSGMMSTIYNAAATCEACHDVIDGRYLRDLTLGREDLEKKYKGNAFPFVCPAEGCGSVFQKIYALFRHVEVGKEKHEAEATVRAVKSLEDGVKHRVSHGFL